MFNPRSELVGINTAILGPSDGNIGIGFAIPINMLRHNAAELFEYGGEVPRGVLEEVAQDLTRELAHPSANGAQARRDDRARRAGQSGGASGARARRCRVSVNGHTIKDEQICATSSVC